MISPTCPQRSTTRIWCPAPGRPLALALAERAGLSDLVGQHLTLAGEGGANAPLKVTCLVAGMVAGADSIDDLDLLRHGGMGRLFTGVRAPSTLGICLRTFTFAHVRQLDAVAARMLPTLRRLAPVLSGIGQVAYLDIDDTVKATHGYQKQGAGYGYTGVNGLTALIATLSTPTSAPLIAATRLRKGAANSARGAARLVADALATTKASGGGVWSSCGPTPPTTTMTWSPPPGAVGPGSRSRPDGHRSGQSHLEHRRGRVDPDPLPERDLGRGRAAAGLRRRSRRSAEHPHSPPARSPNTSPAGSSCAASNASTRPPSRTGRASCSPPGATTRCSPTPPWRCSRRRTSTADTPSSNRSTPTCAPAPWLTYPQDRSPPTVPGRSWPRPRPTSPAPPARSHPCSTPRPPPPQSDDNPSRSRPGRPAPPDDYPAPTEGLALAGRLAGNVRRHLPATRPSDDLTTSPNGRDRRKTSMEEPDRPADPRMPARGSRLRSYRIRWLSLIAIACCQVAGFRLGEQEIGMTEYRPRVADGELADRMRSAGAVLMEGHLGMWEDCDSPASRCHVVPYGDRRRARALVGAAP